MASILRVALKTHSYPIVLGARLLPAIQKEFSAQAKRGRRVIAVVDKTFAQKNHAFVKKLGVETILFPTSEKTKTLAQLQKLLSELSKRKLERTGILAAIGGGVLGDMAGFAAACYLRGIDFYQVPTTLLAMVDSSVGGKTGVNLPEGKNLVGAFRQPLGVFADTELLKTLPAREFNAGMAEVIKTALLADAALFKKLEAISPLKWNSPQLPQIIKTCCAVKARVVAADEFETAKNDGRALLNLGHTFGHAVEKVGGFGNYLHGEAVALGLMMAAHLSVSQKTLSKKDADKISALLKKQGLPVRLKKPLKATALFDALTRDKKVRAGKLRFVTLKKIATAHTVQAIDKKAILAAFKSAGAR